MKAPSPVLLNMRHTMRGACQASPATPTPLPPTAVAMPATCEPCDCLHRQVHGSEGTQVGCGSCRVRPAQASLTGARWWAMQCKECRSHGGKATGPGQQKKKKRARGSSSAHWSSQLWKSGCPSSGYPITSSFASTIGTVLQPVSAAGGGQGWPGEGTPNGGKCERRRRSGRQAGWRHGAVDCVPSEMEAQSGKLRWHTAC
jgi:hypothetical protein